MNIDQIAMFYISMDSSQQALQTYGRLFFKFQISLQNFGWKPKNIQKIREVWILIKLQCFIYQWISLNKLYKLANGKLFSIFIFKLAIGRKLKNIPTAWMLIELKCIMCINGIDSTIQWKAFFFKFQY